MTKVYCRHCNNYRNIVSSRSGILYVLECGEIVPMSLAKFENDTDTVENEKGISKYGNRID
jgi:Fe2+ or Zn2+ uptake regulation protein